MKRFLLLFFVITAAASAQPALQPWSVRLAQSFLRQHPDSIIYPEEEKSRRWNYEQGVMLEAFYRVHRLTGDSAYSSYLKRILDQYIQADGSIRTYKLTEFNIDNITPGVAVLRALELFKERRYRIAADTLRKQLALHPRTAEGGFWHKKIYPQQMWLDGLYMGEPFYALYSKTTRDTAAFNDITRQFILMRDHARDPRTGLFYHGWDASKAMAWADKNTGCSPNFWGRSIGWYLMAIVDVLDHLPAHHPQRKELISIYQDLMRSVLAQRDSATGCWFQVVDKKDAKGNYPEASATAMFSYALAKGVNKAYLPAGMKPLARSVFASLLEQFVSVDGDGTIALRDVVKVSGLGGNPYRDGSVEYYLSEPRRTNDFKGYGPLMMAAVEIDMMTP